MRYAIYFSPAPGSLLHSLGSSWLGRDVFTGSDLPRLNRTIREEVIADAACYGFHATLKPPFHLKPGTTVPGLVAAVEHLAASFDPVPLGQLQLSRIEGFLALTPRRSNPALVSLAATCVRELDGFRAAATEEELLRRRSAKLTATQEAYLVRWGYPYVMDEFRPHMTLTRRLTNEETAEIEKVAWQHFEPAMADPLFIDAVTIFHQPSPDAPFLAFARLPLLGSAARVAS